MEVLRRFNYKIVGLPSSFVENLMISGLSRSTPHSDTVVFSEHLEQTCQYQN